MDRVADNFRRVSGEYQADVQLIDQALDLLAWHVQPLQHRKQLVKSSGISGDCLAAVCLAQSCLGGAWAFPVARAIGGIRCLSGQLRKHPPTSVVAASVS